MDGVPITDVWHPQSSHWAVQKWNQPEEGQILKMNNCGLGGALGPTLIIIYGPLKIIRVHATTISKTRNDTAASAEFVAGHAGAAARGRNRWRKDLKFHPRRPDVFFSWHI